MSHTFKSIQAVPIWQDFTDFILSKTQRKTPTVIHRHFAVSRIRDFYMKKVKFTQQSCHERLTKIIEDFPKIDEIHPFYCDLINVLYDKDHYKIALSQVNMTRNIIDNLAREYVRLMKYGDTLYRCKSLKRVSLGRMMKAIKNIGPSLVYLEQVRQHMSRLPSIDPNMRTLILCGFPNVGKSSFINKVTRADVEVQPYSFTTKSLYVGHTDYNYLRWQVIDTPGILDHPLEDRNTIEMQSITAMAHINACILYMIDISEHCGHTIEEQIQLFKSLIPLFSNKPVVIGLNKIDVITPDNLSEENKTKLSELEQSGVFFVPLSTLTDDGVMKLKQEACDRLLNMRVENKIQSKRFDSILNRLHIAIPQKRDDIKRPPVELPSILSGKYQDAIEPSHEPIPEIMDGKNIIDFVDPNISNKLKIMLLEERLREDAGFYDISKMTDDEVKLFKLNQQIQSEKKLFMMEHALKKNRRCSSLPKSTLLKALINRTTDNIDKQPFHGSDDGEDANEIDLVEGNDDINTPRNAMRSSKLQNMFGRDRSDAQLSHEMNQIKSGIVGDNIRKVDTLKVQHMKKAKKLSRKGEADRHVYDLHPKHLLSGKRKSGKTSRR